MIGDKLELTFTPGDESFEVRVDGRVVARIDRLLMEALQHWATQGEPTPFLEAISIPTSRKVEP